MKISPENYLKYKKKRKTSGQTTIYNILNIWFIKLFMIIVYNIVLFILL